MEVAKVNTEYCSCNFCDKGELKKSGIGLIYPYEYVFEFQREGNGLRPSICKDCLDELYNKVNNITAHPDRTPQSDRQ